MAKIQPAHRTLIYGVGAGTTYIDIARDLSRINRRLYRQGRNYVISKITLLASAGLERDEVVTFSFSAAGNTWVVHNAWKRGFGAWKKQQDKVSEALPGIHGKWADFKVYLDDSHRAGTTADVVAGDGANVNSGEWVYSQFVWDDDGTERENYIHLIGSTDATSTDVGLIEEYGNARARVQEGVPAVENEASDSIYAKMMGTDELTDLLIDNVEGSNDSPPYDANDYPGGAANCDAAWPMSFGSVTMLQGTTTCPGFIAPCGLLNVFIDSVTVDGSVGDVYTDDTPPAMMIAIEVAPGPYRGVLAPPMGQ